MPTLPGQSVGLDPPGPPVVPWGATHSPIIVPCHRVIGADHTLTGFTGGLNIKVALLELEGRELE